MPQESIVEIPSGSGNKYRYRYEDGRTIYRGPVGDAPELDEEKFLFAIRYSLPGWDQLSQTEKNIVSGKASQEERQRYLEEGKSEYRVVAYGDETMSYGDAYFSADSPQEAMRKTTVIHNLWKTVRSRPYEYELRGWKVESDERRGDWDLLYYDNITYHTWITAFSLDEDY